MCTRSPVAPNNTSASEETKLSVASNSLLFSSLSDMPEKPLAHHKIDTRFSSAQNWGNFDQDIRKETGNALLSLLNKAMLNKALSVVMYSVDPPSPLISLTIPGSRRMRPMKEENLMNRQTNFHGKVRTLIIHLQTVIHIILNWMSRHSVSGHLFHLQFDESINKIIRKYSTTSQEFTVPVQ